MSNKMNTSPRIKKNILIFTNVMSKNPNLKLYIYFFPAHSHRSFVQESMSQS